ncbi:MAG: hypothetical protein M3Y42_15185 [Actinomycetota bacterium]|nr:hypothetical protein [Actinomycetota bacterium]MDQ2958296.1 hypothetical protein [Actinomycetota bacterium]
MPQPSSHARRRRFTPLIAFAGLLSTALLAAATTGVLSGFTASITNSANSISTGTLLMQETGQSQTCLSTTASTQIGGNAGVCATINKFGLANTLSVPGSSYTTSITVKNIGSIPAASFTLTPSTCTQTTPAAGTGSNTAFCADVLISIEDDTGTPSCLLGGTAGSACPATPTATLASWSTALNLNATAGSVAPLASRIYKFTVQISGAAGNTDQGLAASEPLVWAFGS